MHPVNPVHLSLPLTALCSPAMKWSLAWLLIAGAARLAAAPLEEHAAAYRDQLTQRILPYWLATLDPIHGGFLLSADALSGPGNVTEKQLVSQARMVWTFAHAHRHGWDTPQHAALAAAWNGYRFLTNHFLDPAHGGYFWKTDRTGHVVDDRKLLYGEAFVLYAFAELHRATQASAPLVEARKLHQLIQQRARDAQHRGWSEHFTRDWRPLPDGDPQAVVEIAGLKSANTHLHLQEAFTELYDVSHDPEVKRSLIEALELNRQYFYPRDPAQSCFHRQPDWRPVTDPRSAGLSYGHNVEFAWLMIRADQVLGRPPDWPHFYAHVNHALAHGYDHPRGGLYHRGAGNAPASDQDKVWWVQAELLAALTDALQQTDNAAHREALDRLIHFLDRYQTDPRTGIWLDTVDAAGTPKRTGLAHAWKANYHDVRALIKFIQAFAPASR